MEPFIFQDGRVRQTAGKLAESLQNQPQSGSLHMVKNALNGGELAPELAGRFDQPRYNTGHHTCYNMIPLAQGGVTRRPPLVSLARTKGSGVTRLLPFVFSSSVTRLLELYEKSGGVGLRVWMSPTQNIDTSLTIPWSAGVLSGVSFCQSADVIYCAHKQIRPGKIMRYSDNNWQYAEINWLPSINPPAIMAITNSDETDQTGSKTRYTYVATSVDQNGEESAPSAAVSHTTFPLSQSFYNTISISAVPGASEYRIYKLKGGVYGFIGRITSGLAFEDRNIGADTEDTPPAWKDPFSGPGNYPALVFLHQQRLGFASSNNKPLTFWLSQTGNYENMSRSIPPDADDAIEATLASGDASRVIWTESDRDGLAFGTGNGEWLLVAGDGAALTPGNLSFQPQTFYGAEEGLPVLRAGNSILFIQKGSDAVREFGYNFSEDRYQSSDVTLLARHMLRGKTIRSWCWQLEPAGIVWFALSDDSFAGLTYLREHDVIAWHRHQSANARMLQVVNIPGFTERNTVVFLVSRQNPQSGEWENWLEYLASVGHKQTRHTDSVYEYPYSGILSPCLATPNLENGSAFGSSLKINSVSARVLSAWAMRVRVCSQNQAPTAWKGMPEYSYAITSITPLDWFCPVAAGFRVNPKLEIKLDRPGTILALSINCEYADNSGTQRK